MPRVGVEELRLVGPGRGLEPLYRGDARDPYMLPFQFTQRLFLASPGGRYLAYQDPEAEVLTVLGGAEPAVIAGVRGADFRFSADRRHLATVRTAADDTASLILFDLARGKGRVLGSVGHVRWLEWVEDGVVVNEIRDGRARLAYFPLRGEPVELASDDALEARFSAARRGSRVVYFAGGHAFTVEVTGGAPVDRGPLPGVLHANVEMAPDGSELALITTEGVFRWTEEAGVFVALAPYGPHSIWYSPDGSQLAYAGFDGAVVLAGGKTYRFEALSGDLRALRFHQGPGGGLLVTRGDRLYLWRPVSGERRVIGRARAGETLLGAGQFSGGTVLWTQTDEPGRRSAKQKRSQRGPGRH